MFGLLTIIFSIFVLSLNPSANFEEARNAERRFEMSQIMSTLNMFLLREDYSMNSLTYSDGKSLPVCKGVEPDFDNGIPFPSLVIAPTMIAGGYMIEHPTDPKGGATPYYNICYDSSGGQLTLYAPNKEGERVTLTR